MFFKKSALLGKLSSFSFFDSFKHASVYFLGTVLVQGLGIISLPVMTYFLSTEEYGITNVYLSYALMASILLSLNLEWAISRYFLEPDADKKGFFTTIIVAVTVIFLLTGAIVFYFSNELGRIMNLPPKLISWLLLYTYSNIVWFAYAQVRIVEKKSKEMTIVQVLIQYSKFGFTVLGIWYLSSLGKEAYMGKIIGEFLINAVAALFLFYILRNYFDFSRIKWSYLRYAINYSLPLVPYAFGGQILSYFDQWYINSELGNEQAGLYSFAYKIGLLMYGLMMALQYASLVQYTKWMDEENYEEISRQAYSIHKLTLLAGLFLILFSVDLGTLLSAKASFREALTIVPIIVGSYIIFGVASLYTRVFNYKKINIYLTVIFLLVAFLNMYLNILYIPIYGYEAAAYTTLVSYAVLAFLAWLLNDFWLKMPALPLLKIVFSLVPLILVSILFYWLGWEKIGMDITVIAFKMLIFCIFGMFLFWELIKRVLIRN
jgi:O-antigen/teichoic acid export membrane protein